MHAAHTLQACQDPHEPTLQQLHHQQQQINNHNESPMNQTSNMTVLETLNPSQPLTEEHQQVMAMIDPIPQQQQHVVQHLVQSASQQQPHLHQLQPSLNSMASMDSTSSQLGTDNEQQQQQQQQQQQDSQQHQTMAVQQSQPHQQHHNVSSSARHLMGTGNHLLRQRPQIEGIVTDGGGPIVQWLLDNYEIADGESLPRSTVYNHYLAHCRQLQMASVNAASFGKLIRSVFIGLKTRRLGTRGHSKYHYFGVRAKQHIQHELMQHQGSGAGCSRDLSMNDNSNQNTENGSESEDSTGNGLDCGRLSSSSSGKRVKRCGDSTNSNRFGRNSELYSHPHQQQQEADIDGGHHGELRAQNHIELGANGVYHTTDNGTNGYAPDVRNNINSNDINSGSTNNNNNKSTLNNNNTNNNNTDHNLASQLAMDQNHCELADFRNHLGANWATLVDEHWPQRDDCDLLERQLVKVTGGSNELANILKLFESKYKLYYKRMVELLSELKFLEVEQLWREFWNSPNGVHSGEQWHEQGQVAAAPNSTNGTDQSHLQQQQNGQQLQSTGDIAQRHIEYQQHLHLQHGQQQQQSHQTSQVIRLDFNQLYQLTSQTIVIERINQIDYCLYDAIESFLLPDMLSPIPSPLALQIRQFAENIGPWIKLSVKDYEPNFVSEKSKSARAFGSALRRYESLNRLSTASRAIWEKRSSLAQMSIDLSRVDLRDIEHQVSLMSRNNISDTKLNLLTNTTSNSTDQSQSGSANSHLSGNQTTLGGDDNLNQQQPGTEPITNNENNLSDHHNNRYHTHHLCTMQPGQLIQNFLHLLEDPYPANSWPDWCRNLVESRVCGPSMEEAKNFVLRWNFYISLIMKELTLRSAPSFASFLLIKSLFDEYIFYLVVSRLAQAQHKTPAQLLSS